MHGSLSVLKCEIALINRVRKRLINQARKQSAERVQKIFLSFLFYE